MKEIENPPPNPYYQRRYVTTINGGYAYFVIPAPGGIVSTLNAKHLISLLEIIIDQLKRDVSDNHSPVPDQPLLHGDASMSKSPFELGEEAVSNFVHPGDNPFTILSDRCSWDFGYFTRYLTTKNGDPKMPPRMSKERIGNNQDNIPAIISGVESGDKEAIFVAHAVLHDAIDHLPGDAISTLMQSVVHLFPQETWVEVAISQTHNKNEEFLKRAKKILHLFVAANKNEQAIIKLLTALDGNSLATES